MAFVLIVDDDLNQSDPLAALLRREGHETACAASAAEARRHLRERTPDLLLVDIMMPVTNGLEALDALTDEPTFADVRFAVFSGSDDPANIAEARRLGAVAYIHKGQRWDAVLEHLRPHLGPAAPSPAAQQAMADPSGAALAPAPQ